MPFLLLLLCVCAFIAHSAPAPTSPAAPAAPAVLQLTGEVDDRRPDILFLAPLPDKKAAPSALAQSLAAARNLGTSLPAGYLSLCDFTELGPLGVLRSAGYRILPADNVPWSKACIALDSILRLRRQTWEKDNIRQQPLCAIVSAPVTPDSLAQSLAPLLNSDALLLIAPQHPDLPLTIVWRNTVWPAHTVPQRIRPEHWIPTLSKITGLPSPADVNDPSILPLLTGTGYQRPLDPVTLHSRSDAPYTELRSYRDLPKTLPWVPDFTDMLPTDRCFIRGTPPFAPQIPELAPFTPSRSTQGLYLRTDLKNHTFRFPAGVSCVIRIKGTPVFSVNAPKTPTEWTLSGPDTVTVECFLLIPPKTDPLAGIRQTKPPTHK